MAERCCWVEIWSEGVLSCIACVIEAISVRLNEEWIEVRVVVSGIMKEGVSLVEVHGKVENRGAKSWKIEVFHGAMAAFGDAFFNGSYVKR